VVIGSSSGKILKRAGGRTYKKIEIANRMYRELLGTKTMAGLSFVVTGYRVSTVDLDEDRIK